MTQNNKKLSSVSFFCPAYEEEDNLPTLVDRVSKFLEEITDTYEIIIVHDGGKDKTGEVADTLAQDIPHVRVIHHPKNLGYGTTLFDGFMASNYEYVMYTDSDNQYDVREFIPYLSLLDTADVLSGYVTKKAVSPRRKIQSFTYNWLVRILFLVPFKDINCSMKIYKRKVLESISIKSKSAFIDTEMIVKAKRAGFRVAQFPVTHFPRMSSIASGSKMSVIIPTIIEMLKFRIGLM